MLVILAYLYNLIKLRKYLLNFQALTLDGCSQEKDVCLMAPMKELIKFLREKA